MMMLLAHHRLVLMYPHQMMMLPIPYYLFYGNIPVAVEECHLDY